jgi:hypothetical protein
MRPAIRTQKLSNEHIQKVGEIVLHDGHTVCEVVSDFRKNDNGGLSFMTRNPETGQTY